MKSQDLKKLDLPKKPGVYFFRDAKDFILYIGKATSLRDRVRSYFAADIIETRGPHILDMVFKSSVVTWEETDTVLEALILEANLIKKYKPYYNTKEKDDKSFNYVCITKETTPKVLIVRGKEIDKKTNTAKGYTLDSVFGPFTSSTSLRVALRIIRKIFPFIDEYSSNKYNKAFYEQLGLIPGTYDIYKKNIQHIKLFFQGKKKKILSELEKEMFLSAKKEEFERAGDIKKQIFALKHLNDIALIKDDDVSLKVGGENFRIEAYDIAHMSGKNMVGVMTVVVNNEAIPREYKKFIIRTQENSNDTGALEEILSRRFRHLEWGLPQLVVVDGGIAQMNVIKQVLDRYQLTIPIVSVLKDQHHKPKDILGDSIMSKKYRKSILLANSEAHRFAIAFHKQKRKDSFLNKKQ
jgi:excinuclease ABC subunit C